MAINSINLFTLDGSNGFCVNGAAPGDKSGYPVSNAGDVNGDGFDDVLIGAFGANPNGETPGASYVVFGKAAGFDATLDLSSLDGNNGFRLDGGNSDSFPYLVSDAGDVNSDGFDDVIIGASGVYDYYANPKAHDGTSYVVFGRASGFAADIDLSNLDGDNGFRLNVTGSGAVSVSSAGDVNGDGFDDVIVGGANSTDRYSGASYVVFGKSEGFDATLDLSNLDGSNGFRLDGVAANDFLGSSVSSAGDVNGDGFDDLIIGALGGGQNGASYVVFGKSEGFDAAMNLSNLDGSNGFRLDGVAPHDMLGYSVSNAGDVNGDGYDDVIVGARNVSISDQNPNSSYVVFGKAGGFSATLDLSSLDGSNGFRMDDGLRRYDVFGLSVSSAGDVNGDGFADVIVGEPDFNPSGDRSHTDYVVFGKASSFPASLDLSSLDGTNGIRLDGGESRSVSSAGDVNGDGFDDMIVGASRAGSNGTSYVIFGRSDFGSVQLPTIPGTSDDDILRGASAAEIFDAWNGNDVLIGGGGADVFRGGAGVDQIKIPDLNFDSIDGGTGNDILHLAGANLNLDLAAFGNHIRGIETICLYGRGDNTLTVTAESLLNLSDTTNTLKVNGNAGDHIVGLSSGWADGGIRGDGYFHVYTQEDAVLLVGLNVTTDFVSMVE